MIKIYQFLLITPFIFLLNSCGLFYTFEEINGVIYRLNNITGDIKPVLQEDNKNTKDIHKNISKQFITLEIGVGDTFESYIYLGNGPFDSTNWKIAKMKEGKTDSGSHFTLLVSKNPWEYAFNSPDDPLGIFNDKELDSLKR